MLPGKGILVVEDEPEIAKVLQASLLRAGFEVATAFDGKAALDAYRVHNPALILLDLRLPRLDGLEVAQQIRQNSDTPIIMVTARVTESDKVRGLRWADDYVTKPFNLQELLARIQCVLRRAQGMAPCPKLQIRDLTIDLENHEVQMQDKAVHLTPAEFELLALLAQHPERVFSRCRLLAAIGSYERDSDLRTIDSHIKNLRRKIEPDPEEPQRIISIYGMGYKFVGK